MSTIWSLQRISASSKYISGCLGEVFLKSFDLLILKLQKKAIHSGRAQSGLSQKYAFIKKSTIFTQSLRNFVKIRYTWGPYFDKLSQWLSKNCGFFNKSIFLPKSGFAWFRLYSILHYKVRYVRMYAIFCVAVAVCKDDGHHDPWGKSPMMRQQDHHSALFCSTWIFLMSTLLT